ncbi:hypothetical protein QFZ77_004811 [Paenibacillus sp. V4I3]|nr:hypothetical protein [Paenibacillus sp. V4I3]
MKAEQRKLSDIELENMIIDFIDISRAFQH